MTQTITKSTDINFALELFDYVLREMQDHLELNPSKRLRYSMETIKTLLNDLSKTNDLDQKIEIISSIRKRIWLWQEARPLSKP